MSSYIVTRRIAIDAGHRIASHGSKCRNLHGHRYDIEAECRTVAGLHETGEQAGMAVDFGFLKQAMMAIIDGPCDHGLIVDINDRALLDLLAPDTGAESWRARLAAEVADQGWAERQDGQLATKLYAMDCPPTAEALARHWFDRLAPWVEELSLGRAALSAVTVHETPNCTACYRP